VRGCAGVLQEILDEAPHPLHRSAHQRCKFDDFGRRRTAHQGDDNEDIAELMSHALAMEGLEIAVEYAGQAGLERWRSFRPHAAVLDVGLPEMDGYELARRLREEYGIDPVLITATGYGRRADRRMASERPSRAAPRIDRKYQRQVSLRTLRQPHLILHRYERNEDGRGLLLRRNLPVRRRLQAGSGARPQARPEGRAEDESPEAAEKQLCGAAETWDTPQHYLI
jgi:CheY-like chemotaxis protein